MNAKYKVTDFTIEEKIKLLAGKDTWHTEDFDGKIYCVKVSDGPVGLRTPALDEKGEYEDQPAVAYPSTQILAQTWREELAYRTGRYLADDCIEKGVDVLLAPGINIKRDPRCGRNFEYISEDPLLSGIFGREYTRGLQDKHVGATVKHFCCNNLETARLWTSSEVSERPLREIYVRAFEIALEADPWTVMSSYNLVNGIRMSEHKKLYDLLRENMGFKGLIMSDWGAVQDHAASVKAGLDLEMPYSVSGYENLKRAYTEGVVSEEEIDACVQRVLDFIALCEEESAKRKVESTREERLDFAEKVAEEGIVLLKNDGVLPLKQKARVSLTGYAAANYTAGGGSSRVRLAGKVSSLADCLKEVIPDGEFSYNSVEPDETAENIPVAVRAAYGKDAAIVCVGTEDSEGMDREYISLPKKQEKLILETAKKNANTVVIVFGGSAVDMRVWIDKVAAVVWAGYPGERGRIALAKILGGKSNPSGRLTESFPMSLDDTSVAKCYSDAAVNCYTDGLLVGYRHYDFHNIKTLFPFGFGLGYSEFAYSNLAIIKSGDKVAVSFDIANVSETDGAETAQVYVKEANAKVLRPVKELKGYKKVWLKAGEKKRVEITLDRSAFAYYSEAFDRWTVDAGQFEILVGENAESILLHATIDLE